MYRECVFAVGGICRSVSIEAEPQLTNASLTETG